MRAPGNANAALSRLTCSTDFSPAATARASSARLAAFSRALAAASYMHRIMP